MMQSSIEFLLDNLHLKDSLKWMDIVEQAHAMHEEEIERAFNEGENNSVDYFNLENRIKECEQYYNETFGGNNEQQ